MTKIKSLMFATAAVALAANTSFAQEAGPLLDVLVKKKILTTKEADEVRKELVTEEAKSSDNKFKLSEPVKEIKLYGDGRFRYANEEGKAAGTTDHGDRERWRYRLRLGMDIKLADNWLLGFQLEAGPTPRSANVTAGENPGFYKGGVSTTTVVSGVTTGKVITGFDKSGKAITGTAVTAFKTTPVVTSVNWEDAVFIGRLFLKYNPTEWLALEAGRMPNPFVGGNAGASGSMSMVWDPDINPQGVAEQFKHTFDLGGGTAGGYAKDGKTMVPGQPGMTLDLFANFGQFVYEDVMENPFDKGTVQSPSRADRWMLGFQTGVKLNFDKSTYFQVAPSFYNYTGGGNATAINFNGDGPGVHFNKSTVPSAVTLNQAGVNDLAILDIPVEFGWKMWNLPFVVFGEFADNLTASQRAEKAGHPDKTAAIAWSAGLGVGKIKKKGDWELKAWWQHSEQFSLDPNLIDDDIFNGRLNMEGVVARAAYAFTDAASFSVIYAHGTRIDKELGTGGSSSLGATPLDAANMLFLDVNLKF